MPSKGWTKFTDFGDLNALSEEDWDKVGWSNLLESAGQSFNMGTSVGQLTAKAICICFVKHYQHSMLTLTAGSS